MRWEARIMGSGTSFFNKTVYKNALSRFWPLGLGLAAVWTWRLLQVLSRSDTGYIFEQASYGLGLEAIQSYVPAAACLLMAMAVFGWLHQTRSAAFMAALPIRREAIFVSDLAAGYTLLLSAAVLSGGLALLLGSGFGAAAVPMGRWLAITALLCLAYFGLAALCAMLTGHWLMLPALYLALLYAAVALEASVRRIAQYLIFGLTGQRWVLEILSPVYHLRTFGRNMINIEFQPDGAFTVSMGGLWPVLAAYAGAGLCFALLAAALLKKRDLECAGDVAAVPFLKKLFPWCCAAALALSAGLMTLESIFGYSGYAATGSGFHQAAILLFLMLLGGFVGWFGAWMLLRKTIRVFDRHWKGWAVFSAAVLALTLATDLDVLGVERRLPAAEEVDRVEVWCYYANVPRTVLRQPENIRSAIAMQQKIIDNKALYEATGPSSIAGGTLELTYYDRDGRQLLHRAYAAPAGEMAWTSNGNSMYWATAENAQPMRWAEANPALPDLEALVNTREAIRGRLEPEGRNLSAETANNAYIYAYDSDWANEILLELDGAETWELYENAILPDSRDTSLGSLKLTPADDGSYMWGRAVIGINFSENRPGQDYYWWGTTLNNTPDSHRLNAWLTEHGIPIGPDGRIQHTAEEQSGGGAP